MSNRSANIEIDWKDSDTRQLGLPSHTKSQLITTDLDNYKLTVPVEGEDPEDGHYLERTAPVT